MPALKAEKSPAWPTIVSPPETVASTSAETPRGSRAMPEIVTSAMSKPAIRVRVSSSVMTEPATDLIV